MGNPSSKDAEGGPSWRHVNVTRIFLLGGHVERAVPKRARELAQCDEKVLAGLDIAGLNILAHFAAGAAPSVAVYL